MSDSFVRKSGKWIVPPPPRKHRCVFPGPAQTFSKGVVWACHCGDAWTNDPLDLTSYPYSGWTRASQHDLEADAIEVQETEPVKYGRRKEQQAIVKWLRSKEEMVEVYTDTDGENSWRILSGSTVADAIDAGIHLRGDDE